MKIQVVTNNILLVTKFYFVTNIIYNNDKKEVVTNFIISDKYYLSLISIHFIFIIKIITNAHSSSQLRYLWQKEKKWVCYKYYILLVYLFSITIDKLFIIKNLKQLWDNN